MSEDQSSSDDHSQGFPEGAHRVGCLQAQREIDQRAHMHLDGWWARHARELVRQLVDVTFLVHLGNIVAHVGDTSKTSCDYAISVGRAQPNVPLEESFELADWEEGVLEALQIYLHLGARHDLQLHRDECTH